MASSLEKPNPPEPASSRPALVAQASEVTPGQPLNLVRRYQIFFLLTAILPILVFAFLFVETTYLKLNQRNANLLHSGALFIQDSVQDNYDELQISSHQATALSLSEKYQLYIKSGDFSPLDTVLKRYEQTNPYDVVFLINNRKEILHNVADTRAINLASINLMLEEALRGKSITGIKRFQIRDEEGVHLAYVSLSPILSPDTGEVNGILFIGRYLKEDSSFNRLEDMIPDYLLRVAVDDGDSPHVEFSNRGQPPGSLFTPELGNAFRQLAVTPKQTTELAGTFDERIGGQEYLTALIGLKNPQGEPVGAIAISLPKNDWRDLARDNLWLVGGILLLILLLVLVAGAWFKRDFIDPMLALAQGAKQVAQGNLSVRIDRPPKANPDAEHTIQSFNRMLDRLEDGDKLRSTFISTLAHDLKTPLLAQKRALEILGEDFRAQNLPELERLVNALSNNNSNLLGLVNKLLDIFRFENGQVPLKREAIDMIALVDECLLDLLPLSASSGIALRHLPVGPVPAMEGDRNQLKRIVTNLLANALEHSPPASTVQVKTAADDEMLRITVSDSGPGIHPDVRPFIFDRYFTLHRTRKKIGTGLGLYICRMIAEAHGGSIRLIEGTDLPGACFEVMLPLQSKRRNADDHLAFQPDRG